MKKHRGKPSQDYGEYDKLSSGKQSRLSAFEVKEDED